MQSLTSALLQLFVIMGDEPLLSYSSLFNLDLLSKCSESPISDLNGSDGAACDQDRGVTSPGPRTTDRGSADN